MADHTNGNGTNGNGANGNGKPKRPKPAIDKTTEPPSLKAATTKRIGTPQTNKNSLKNLEGHEWPKGVSGNPGGKPKRLSNAYAEWFELVNPDDPLHRTNVELVADAVGRAAREFGDVAAAREMRQATEGDRLALTSWQSEIVDALKQQLLTAAEVVTQLGLEQATPLLLAAGLPQPTALATPPELVPDADDEDNAQPE